VGYVSDLFTIAKSVYKGTLGFIYTAMGVEFVRDTVLPAIKNSWMARKIYTPIKDGLGKIVKEVKEKINKYPKLVKAISIAGKIAKATMTFLTNEHVARAVWIGGAVLTLTIAIVAVGAGTGGVGAAVIAGVALGTAVVASGIAATYELYQNHKLRKLDREKKLLKVNDGLQRSIEKSLSKNPKLANILDLISVSSLKDKGGKGKLGDKLKPTILGSAVGFALTSGFEYVVPALPTGLSIVFLASNPIAILTISAQCVAAVVGTGSGIKARYNAKKEEKLLRVSIDESREIEHISAYKNVDDLANINRKIAIEHRAFDQLVEEGIRHLNEVEIIKKFNGIQAEHLMK